MSFDFAGTFTTSQFARLKQYARNQLALVDGRVAHLKAERDRIGTLAFAFDQGGLPTHTTSDPPTTYIGKLYAAYEALGGDVEFDLQVRSSKQPVFMIAGDLNRAPQLMSNGEVMNKAGLGDAPSVKLVQKIKGYVAGDLHRRREYLERKIRRALDYAEQLDQEIARLEMMRAGADTADSLEACIKIIDELGSDKRYLAITDDAAQPDPHGKFARAPIAPYNPGPKGTSATAYERTADGFVKPSQ